MRTTSSSLNLHHFVSNPSWKGIVLYGPCEASKNFFLSYLLWLRPVSFVGQAQFCENPSFYIFPDLFDDKPFFSVIDASNGCWDVYKTHLTDDLPTKTILCTQEKQKTSLVQWAMESKSLYAVACYSLSSLQHQNLVKNYAYQMGLSMPLDALEVFAHQTPLDHLMSHLKKLFFYKKNAEELNPQTPFSWSVHHVVACLGKQHAILYQDLSHFILEKNWPQVVQFFEANKTDVLPVKIVRHLVHHFLRLLRIKQDVCKGCSFQEALSHLPVAPFFKTIPLLQKAVQEWSVGSINQVLIFLYQEEIRLKSNGNPLGVFFLCQRLCFPSAAQ